MVTRSTGSLAAIGRTLVAAIAILGASPSQADPLPTENEVKAAYLFNFARFVEWPATAFEHPHSPFVIGVIGDETMADVLRTTVAGRAVRDRPVVIEELVTAADARVHILFVGAGQTFALPRVLRQVEDRPILTVGDIEGFAEGGGMVRFALEQNRVRFDVNRHEIERAGLDISSHVLRLARRVLPDTG
jgi:hypothetical protein